MKWRGTLGISEGNEQKGKKQASIALLRQFFLYVLSNAASSTIALLTIINDYQYMSTIPEGLIYIKTVYLDFRTFKIEALVQLLPESISDTCPDV